MDSYLDSAIPVPATAFYSFAENTGCQTSPSFIHSRFRVRKQRAKKSVNSSINLMCERVLAAFQSVAAAVWQAQSVTQTFLVYLERYGLGHIPKLGMNCIFRSGYLTPGWIQSNDWDLSTSPTKEHKIKGFAVYALNYHSSNSEDVREPTELSRGASRPFKLTIEVTNWDPVSTWICSQWSYRIPLNVYDARYGSFLEAMVDELKMRTQCWMTCCPWRRSARWTRPSFVWIQV